MTNEKVDETLKVTKFLKDTLDGSGVNSVKLGKSLVNTTGLIDKLSRLTVVQEAVQNPCLVNFPLLGEINLSDYMFNTSYLGNTTLATLPIELIGNIALDIAFVTAVGFAKGLIKEEDTLYPYANNIKLPELHLNLQEIYNTKKEKYQVLNSAIIKGEEDVLKLIQIDNGLSSELSIRRRIALLKSAPDLIKYYDSSIAVTESLQGTLVANSYKLANFFGSSLQKIAELSFPLDEDSEEIGSHDISSGDYHQMILNLINPIYIATKFTLGLKTNFIDAVTEGVISGFVKAISKKSDNQTLEDIIKTQSKESDLNLPYKIYHDSKNYFSLLNEMYNESYAQRVKNNQTLDDKIKTDGIEKVLTNHILVPHIIDVLLREQQTDKRNSHSLEAVLVSTREPMVKMVHDTVFNLLKSPKHICDYVTLGKITDPSKIKLSISLDDIHKIVSTTQHRGNTVEIVLEDYLQHTYKKLPKKEQENFTYEDFAQKNKNRYKVVLSAGVKDLEDYAKSKRRGDKKAQIPFVDYFRNRGNKLNIDKDSIDIDFSAIKDSKGNYRFKKIIQGDLSGADLSEIPFEGAVFNEQAKLSGVKFSKSNICGANFNRAIGLDVALCEDAYHDSRTTIKDGWFRDFTLQEELKNLNKHHKLKGLVLTDTKELTLNPTKTPYNTDQSTQNKFLPPSTGGRN